MILISRNTCSVVSFFQTSDQAWRGKLKAIIYYSQLLHLETEKSQPFLYNFFPSTRNTAMIPTILRLFTSNGSYHFVHCQKAQQSQKGFLKITLSNYSAESSHTLLTQVCTSCSTPSLPTSPSFCNAALLLSHSYLQMIIKDRLLSHLRGLPDPPIWQ